MGRRYNALLAAIVVGVAFCGVAYGGVPDPSFCTVPNVLVSPAGTMEYIVYVGDSGGALDSINVQIVLSAEAESLGCWCVGESTPIISTYSDINGEAHFFIDGGGCINPDSVSGGPPAQVFGNGILLADVGIVSVDAVDIAGLLPTQGWDPMGSCTCGLSDATKFTAPITTGTYEYCADLNSDLSIDLEDAVAITVPLTAGHTCTRAP
jgi:hypothetical protein